MRRPRLVAGLVVLVVLAAVYGVLARPPAYAPRLPPAPTDFERYYQDRLAESRAHGVRPGNEERLRRAAPGPTPLALLYLHGFSASRSEGEAVVDAVAAEQGANVYYLRLPGHGSTKEDLQTVTFGDYLDCALAAAQAARLLGRRLVLVGTSTGALLAAYVAAERPDLVDGLVLASPLFEFGDHRANLPAYPGGVALGELIIGSPLRRIPFNPKNPEDHRVPGFEAAFYTEYFVSSLRPLAQLKRHVARPELLARVAAPALMLTYERDASHRDRVIDLAAVHAAFQGFGAATPRRGPHPLSRAVAVADSDHVMLSAHVRADHAAPRAAISAFLGDLLRAAPR